METMLNLSMIIALIILSIFMVVCTIIAILSYRMDKKETEEKFIKEIDEIVSSYWGD